MSLVIYDLQGRDVKRLAEERLEAGWRTFAWNADDSRGHAVSPGIYLARLSIGGRALRTHRVVVLR